MTPPHIAPPGESRGIASFFLPLVQQEPSPPLADLAENTCPLVKLLKGSLSSDFCFSKISITDTAICTSNHHTVSATVLQEETKAKTTNEIPFHQVLYPQQCNFPPNSFKDFTKDQESGRKGSKKQGTWKSDANGRSLRWRLCGACAHSSAVPLKCMQLTTCQLCLKKAL